MAREIDGLKVVRARSGGADIAATEPLKEITAAIAAGMIVIVKGAFDPAELRRIRAAILAWDAPAGEPDTSTGAPSSRYRGEDPPGTQINHVFESFFFAVNNADDAIGPAVRASFARLATFWRSLTGGVHDFAPGADGKAIQPWINYYPVGGGYFDWHEHPLEPTKIGLIVNMSQIGVDFSTGATEFRTPFGIINTTSSHDIGDICLFRYDLPHRVTPIDPDSERRWGNHGRWTMVIPVR